MRGVGFLRALLDGSIDARWWYTRMTYVHTLYMKGGARQDDALQDGGRGLHRGGGLARGEGGADGKNK